MRYIGLDGDNIGRLVESYFIENNVSKLVEFSRNVVRALDEIRIMGEHNGADVLFCTGDSILLYGDIDVSFGTEMLEVFHRETGKTASVGIGQNMANTYLGLKLAKSRGGGQVVHYQGEF